jgi:hypothetical protein
MTVNCPRCGKPLSLVDGGYTCGDHEFGIEVWVKELERGQVNLDPATGFHAGNPYPATCLFYTGMSCSQPEITREEFEACGGECKRFVPSVCLWPCPLKPDQDETRLTRLGIQGSSGHSRQETGARKERLTSEQGQVPCPYYSARTCTTLDSTCMGNFENCNVYHRDLAAPACPPALRSLVQRIKDWIKKDMLLTRSRDHCQAYGTLQMLQTNIAKWEEELARGSE